MVKKQEIVSVLVLEIISTLPCNEQDHKSILSSYVYQHSMGHNLSGNKDSSAALPSFSICWFETGNSWDINGDYWLGDVQESRHLT